MEPTAHGKSVWFNLDWQHCDTRGEVQTTLSGPFDTMLMMWYRGPNSTFWIVNRPIIPLSIHLRAFNRVMETIVEHKHWSSLSDVPSSHNIRSRGTSPFEIELFASRFYIDPLPCFQVYVSLFVFH